VVFKEKYENIHGILNIVFVIIDYYFGAKRGRKGEEEDE